MVEKAARLMFFVKFAPMSTLIQISIVPYQIEDEALLLDLALDKAKILKKDVCDWQIRKRSIDARRAPVKINLQLEIWLDNDERKGIHPFVLQKVSDAKKIAIIGMGPAGMYAALRAIEGGFKPVIFERGKDVRARRRDLAKITKEQNVNPSTQASYKRSY